MSYFVQPTVPNPEIYSQLIRFHAFFFLTCFLKWENFPFVCQESTYRRLKVVVAWWESWASWRLHSAQIFIWLSRSKRNLRMLHNVIVFLSSEHTPRRTVKVVSEMLEVFKRQRVSYTMVQHLLFWCHSVCMSLFVCVGFVFLVIYHTSKANGSLLAAQIVISAWKGITVKHSSPTPDYKNPNRLCGCQRTALYEWLPTPTISSNFT